MLKKIAFITGVTGQDGSFLAELLLSKGYEVHGLIRRSSTFNRGRIEHLYLDDFLQDNRFHGKFHLHYGDMTDSSNLVRLIKEIKPSEIYNLAAQSHVLVSFEIPESTAEVDALGTLRLMEAVRILGMEKSVRIYHASTSELYGKVVEIPQNETTPFYPRSPYGVSKLFAFWTVKNYREAYAFHASNGILFNHESERRGESFVTRKITLAVSAIKHGVKEKLALGNLNAKRDWGYARDYIESMWLMLQKETPDDYVVATGEMHSVREFAELAFHIAGFDIVWEGSGIHETGKDKNTGRILVEIDPRYFRPTEVDLLIGDPSKAVKELGWNPRKTSFEKLVEIMVQHDLAQTGKNRK